MSAQPPQPSSLTAWPLGEVMTKAAQRLEADGQVLLGGVEGAARAFALARLYLRAPRTILLVTPTLGAAESLCRDLEFFLGGPDGQSPVRLFPSYEVSPYQGVDPPAEVTAQRLKVMWELLAAHEPLLVAAPAGAINARLCPPEYLVDASIAVAPGREFDRDDLVRRLTRMGYTNMSLAEQVGDLAVRGAVLDVFGPLHDEPLRLEFFGDQIDSLRRFDPVDQRSQLPVEEADLIPCHPVDLSPGAIQKALDRARRLAHEEGLSSRKLAELVDKMELGAPFDGMESLLSLYFDQANDLFDYLPGDAWHVIIEPAEVTKRLEVEYAELQEQFAQAREQGEVALTPPMMRRTPDQVAHALARRPCLWCRSLAMVGDDSAETEFLRLKAATHPGLHQDLARAGEGSILDHFLGWCGEHWAQGRDVALVCRSQGQVERLAELLGEKQAPVRAVAGPGEVWRGGPREDLAILRGGLTAGFSPAELPVVWVTEDEVLGRPKVVRQKATKRLSEMLAALDDLEPGDLVVHVDHGVGVYQGLESVAVGPAEGDFLLITYQGGDKLFLPADRIGLISKYRGPGETKPALDKLGGKGWEKTKARVKKAVEAVAHDLVELYAQRQVQKGHAFSPPDRSFREFEASFGFSETPDQAKAIAETIEDLIQPKPMDRLICGDVGFGKTEVAIRAAYLVASQGKQVAFLVPTTVLAEQHYQTLSERLKGEPFLVESISRFKTTAQQKEILARLAEGKIDIIVGTHRVLSQDVKFKDLGLIVVDEEQRFGVRDKERLKKLRRLVDVLTLTATPIPRTMQMSLSGIRDLSSIHTPPQDRQAIKTYLAAFNPKAVGDAVKRELERQGQVFFVHNRVQDLARFGRMLQQMVPEARIGIAHGQLPEKALETVMTQFVRRELDILVCTTIIENGLDIPSANTIIIHNADKLGLAQIYQLRGRVGRGDRRAYAYLFIQSERSLSSDARKRLKALMDFTELGSGFAIAMHDLQIRGAGNMLGEAQSGTVAEVGYELYIRMLEEAIARLKGEAPAEGPEPELNLGLEAGLPESYVPDGHVRLSLYKRLSQTRRDQELEEVGQELADRFGPPPQAVQNLLWGVGLKNLMRRLRAHRLDVAAEALTVHFSDTSRLRVDLLLDMAQKQPQRIRVFPDGRVTLRLGAHEQEALAGAREFLGQIASEEA